MLSDFGLEETNAKICAAGQVFGRLTVIALGQVPGTYRYMAVCSCSCGSSPKAYRADHLVSGNTQSCGCFHKEQTTSHGLTDSGHYSRWRNMMQRCYDTEDSAYHNYGGRGIKVHEAWHDIRNFVADLPEGYERGFEIDRIDNSGNYEPGNIKWSTRRQNSANRRTRRNIELNGRIQSITEWSRETGIPAIAIRNRLDDLGWSIEDALTEPLADREENMRRVQALRWEGHVKMPQPEPRVIQTFLFDGQLQTLKQISEKTGISHKLLRKRICERGWSVEKATAKVA